MKTYESYINKLNGSISPTIGDYVIIKFQAEDISDFVQENDLENHIGRIEDIVIEPKGKRNKFPYSVIFSHITKGNNTYLISRNEIIHFSPNKEDLQVYLDAKRYNL